MAADQAGPYSLHSLRRLLVLAILAVAARRRRAARRARAASRPYDRVALGAAVRSRTGVTHTAASQADPRILARGRDLRSRTGPLVLPLSGHRFSRCHLCPRLVERGRSSNRPTRWSARKCPALASGTNPSGQTVDGTSAVAADSFRT